MSSKRILYGIDRSPPVRAVRMTLLALGLEYDYKGIEPSAGETKTPEYLKKNPQHTIPTLEEPDGRCIGDSHAIMAYLVRKYGKDSPLYPADCYERAIVDQRLHFENGVLFMDLGRNTLGGILRGTAKKENLPDMYKSIEEKFEVLEAFLGDNDYMAGSHLTIADFSIVATVGVIELMLPIDAAKFPKLAAWFARMKNLPYYEKINAEGIGQIGAMLKAKIAELP